MFVQPRVRFAAHATNTPIFGKLNPNQNLNTPAMPKIHECVGVSRGGAIAVSSWPATHTSFVPCIPRAPTPTLAPTFEKTPTPNRRNCGNPKGQATTTANLFCNRGKGGHALQQLELLDTHPLFTGRCPQCEMTYPKYEQPPVHWDCPECGWMDDSV
jgi:hypothetical protein